MSGKWIYKAKKEKVHKCRLPRLFPWRHAGSEWECNCGRKWYIAIKEERLDMYFYEYKEWVECW